MNGPLADVCDTQLHRAVRAYSRARLLKVARLAKHRMQRWPASGIFGGDEHERLWHEYRYEVENGPTPMLESAWEKTIHDFVGGALLTLIPDEAVLCSIGASWDMDGDEADLANEPAIFGDALKNVVSAILHEMADRENFGGGAAGL